MKTLERTARRDAPAAADKRDLPKAQAAGAPAALDNLTLLASGALRAKLHAGAPGDPLEMEADRMADDALSGKPAGCHCAPGKPPCSACQAAALLRKPRRYAASPPVPSHLPLGPERRLANTDREFFESRYGADLSGVRIHDNPEANDSAARMDARAFSIGDRIAFGRDEYRPDTGTGRRLLGHELAHVVQGHSGIRREGNPGGGDKPAPLPTAATDFDPCTLDIKQLDNRALLAHFALAEKYLNRLLAEKRKGEERYYDYANLMGRLRAERSARAATGHVWLKANVSDVPGTLWRLEASAFSSVISVTPGDTKAAGANGAVGGAILLTDGQFSDFLAKEKIPTVDPGTYFAQQDPNQPKPLNIEVPQREEQAPPSVDPYNLFGTWDDSVGPSGETGFAGWAPGWGIPPPQSAQSAVRWGAFAKPVVTAGQYNFNDSQLGGFRYDWRGNYGEARFLSGDPASIGIIVDVNRWQRNFELLDAYDPRTGELISIKSQLPETPGGDASLAEPQKAWRELFGNADPAKRTTALQRLQGRPEFGPTYTQAQMLLNARIAVNPENVTALQDSLANAISRNKTGYYEPLLSAMLSQQAINVTMKDGSTKTYGDFATLHADYKAKPPLIDKANYDAALDTLAQRARNQIISHGSSAEGELRPRLDYRQRYDFRNASDFTGFPDTPPGRRDARALQEKYFERIGTPELLDIQAGGYGPMLKSAGKTGGAMGLGTTALLDAPQLYRTWDKDPYAGRRYLANVALSGAGGTAQAVGDQAFRTAVSQRGLEWAASRAAAGESVGPLARLLPATRFAGSTALGGVASGGITIGSMYLDERYFGADYSTIDYSAKGTRAFVVGSAAAGAGVAVGALATAGAVALYGGGGGAAGCTFVLPGVGTVACGAVGTVGGFIAGLGAYYLFDYAVGDEIEEGVREAMGEKGCSGKTPPAPAPAASTPKRESTILACFAADTPVLLADRSTRPIGGVAVGDLLLSWNERAQRLEQREVTAVHVHPPAAMLELALADGTTIRVTPTHKLRTNTGWSAAIDLRPGDTLQCAGSGELPGACALAAVTLGPPGGDVYDLSVAGTHTYFAGGVLAHNKLP